jgi:hypothetical protein
MAFELHRSGYPAIAASAINDRAAVALDSGDTQRQVVPIATNNVEPFGVTIATAVNPGDGITVLDPLNTVKVTACASLGAAAAVGVASTNGQFGPVSGASGVTRWQVGKSVTAAAAGETFSLYVKPQQLSNLI